ncbi:hypothetical protein ACPF7I_08345 [Anoxybacillus sp. D401a]|uniref:hypothetical protein n=1 Tax=Anoxybacillus sp. D401a TaxID=575112 RepID=UPI003D331FB3
MDKTLYTEGINAIIELYNYSVKGVSKVAEETINRAFGGVIRAEKGKLVEKMAQMMTLLAWRDVLGQDIKRIKMDRKKIKVPINDEYINNIRDENVKKIIQKERDRFYYKIGTDVHVYIDGKFVMAIECKAYTENAMLKRILVDATLLKKFAEVQKFVLLQLESQLGGDYSQLNFITIGSPSTRTLMSYFDIDLEIITLLKGERDIDKPIHNSSYFKELTHSSVNKAILTLSNILKSFV